MDPFLMKLTAKGKYYAELSVMLLVIIPALVYWDSAVIFPVKLFVVLLHESSHAFAALLTGGTVSEISINFELGGNCVSKGGYVPLIACAGYIGSLISGVLLLYSSTHYTRGKMICNIFAGLFSLMILLMNSFWGILAASVFALLMIVSPRFLPEFVHHTFMAVLGTLISLYAIIDIREDLFNSEYIMTDAQMMAGITGIPAIVWSLFWLLLSVVVLYLMLKRKFGKGKPGVK
ncbi:MAG: M50 family metallopeptidase [Syntrophothermus sp.]